MQVPVPVQVPVRVPVPEQELLPVPELLQNVWPSAVRRLLPEPVLPVRYLLPELPGGVPVPVPELLLQPLPSWQLRRSSLPLLHHIQLHLP